MDPTAPARPRVGLRVRGLDSHRRTELDRGWSVARRPRDLPADPLPALQWQALERCGPLATAGAAVRAGVERLDGEDWCWHLRFDAPADDSADGPWVLGFDGLATQARAWLNGVLLLDSESMFVAHECVLGEPGGPALRAQDNELVIVCRALDAALALRRPRPRWRTPMVEHQQLRWWRTSLIGRTPGWSPALPPVGPWRPVWLERRSLVQARTQRLQATLDGRAGRLSIAADLRAAPGWRIARASLVATREGRRWSAALTPPTADAAEPDWRGRLLIDAVRPWWPHTHGEPALYDAAVELVLVPEQGGAARIARADLGAVGFRRIERDPAAGDGFGLRVNGEAVFARGACWTPMDVRRLVAEPAAVRAALRQVREAGMNLLRVAGPLVYEDEAFFDACDAEGVMVWQDFMFANMDVPARLPAATDPLAEPLLPRGDDPSARLGAWIACEVRQQLERWQARACLAVVCGNSEVSQQAAMWGADRALWEPALFHEDLPRWVAAWLPDTLYWPSSAHGGAWPFAPATGTASYYGVGAYRREPEDARSSGLRFATECLAFAQVPGAATLARLPGGGAHPHQPAWKAASPRDLGAGWDFDDVRDHYLAGLHGEDPVRWRGRDPAGYLAASRHVTGLVMAEAFGRWRAAGSSCRGALVWWWRDLQPGAGWGLLDDLGEPKPAWHVLRRALQPTALVWQDEGLNGLRLHLVHEGPRPQAVRLELRVWRSDGGVVLEQATDLELAPRSLQVLELASLGVGFADLANAYGFAPAAAEGAHARLVEADGTVLAEAQHWFERAWRRKSRIGLRLALERDADGEAWLRVGTSEAARGVMLDVPQAQVDDDAFDLPPQGERRVRLRRRDAARAGLLTASARALNSEEQVHASG